jgi:excisionase family DNA binding protein
MGRPAKPMTPAVETCADGALSIDGAAAFANVGRTEIYEAVKRGELELFHHGRRALVPKRQVVEWLAAKLEAARAERGAGART